MYDSTNSDIVTTVATSKQKEVVLTFDDGPSRVLPEILTILKGEDIPAVFFWQSKLLYPARPWQQVLKEGHMIGSHSVKHRHLIKLDYDEQFKVMKQSISQLEKVTGQKVKYFRPPFGSFNEDTLLAAEELGLTTVMWRIASFDWELKENPREIISNVVDHLEDGAIILLHELQQTVQILPDLIHAIKDKGFEFSLLK